MVTLAMRWLEQPRMLSTQALAPNPVERTAARDEMPYGIAFLASRHRASPPAPTCRSAAC
jgi:hypothetical protein